MRPLKLKAKADIPLPYGYKNSRIFWDWAVREIIVLEQLPDLEQKVRMHQVDLITGAFCLFLQVLAVVFKILNMVSPE